MLIRLVLVLAPVGAVIVACGGSSDEPESSTTTAPTVATPVAAATTQPTATPDPKAVASAKTFEAIKQSRKFADDLIILSDLASRIGAQPGDAMAVYNKCNNNTGDGRGPFGYNEFANPDLWPKPYKDLDENAAGFCIRLFDKKKTLGDPTNSTEWKAFLKDGGQQIDRAKKALPDYSEAQLKRAIEDRQ